MAPNNPRAIMALALEVARNGAIPWVLAALIRGLVSSLSSALDTVENRDAEIEILRKHLGDAYAKGWRSGITEVQVDAAAQRVDDAREREIEEQQAVSIVYNLFARIRTLTEELAEAKVKIVAAQQG